MGSLQETAFHRAATVLSAWRRPLLVSHVKPDGDALGALMAMWSILTARGANPLALLFENLPRRFALFERYARLPVLGRDVSEADFGHVDGVLILDTCTFNQLEPIAAWLRKYRESGEQLGRRSSSSPRRRGQDILAVDHHVTRDDLADEYLVDESAAATCLILYEWAKIEGWTLNPQARDALFVGIATDTGWFQYSNTDGRALEAAAELVGQGVVPHELHQQLYRQDPPSRVRLLGAALETLELLANERLAVMTLSSSALSRCGAIAADTEDIVNEPLRIGSVGVSVLLVEESEPRRGVRGSSAANQRVRVSFRSKPPLATPTQTPPRAKGTGRMDAANAAACGPVPDVDVAQVAQSFGGGGHPRAAGARIEGALSDVKLRVTERVMSALTRL